MTVHPHHTDAVQFHSAIVGQFHQLYHHSTDFKERFNVWTRLLNQYIPPGSFVLDAGCGSGVFSFSLAAQGHRVLGIDGSAAMIQHCQKIREETGSFTASFQQSSLPLQEPLTDRAFDAVMASSVLEYVPALDSALLSLSSQLASGGYFFFSLPNRTSLYRKLERVFFRLTGRPAYLRYVRHYRSVSTLTPSLEKAGLRVVDLHHYGGNTVGFRLLKATLPPAWICPLFVVVCRKR